jgi:hypothetical protein
VQGKPVNKLKGYFEMFFSAHKPRASKCMAIVAITLDSKHFAAENLAKLL